MKQSSHRKHLSPRKTVAVAALILIVGMWYVQGTPSGNADALEHAVSNPEASYLQHKAAVDNPQASYLQHKAAPRSPSWGASPFGMGPGILPTKDDEQSVADFTVTDEQVFNKQSKALTQMGYNVQENFKALSREDLLLLTKSSDGALKNNAKVYLAETILQQRDEPSSLNEAPDLQRAKSLLLEAVSSGHVRAASVLATVALMESKPVDAYAWGRISEMMGDPFSQESFQFIRRADYFNEQFKTLAEMRVAELSIQINGSKTKAQ